MGQRTLLPNGGEVVLDQLQVQGRDRIHMVLRSAGTANSCPVCQRRSDRIHSCYRRWLSDLPWEGISVRIELQVRRFFCGSDGCPQRIFAERLPKTAPRYARRTSRLSLALEQITLALDGSAGSRLAEQLGILASDSTLLRQLRRKTVASTTQAPRVLGIDDWAWRKGRRYGTILCDLERGKVVDLLPDRSAESTARWLGAHPGIEIVSRDRASLYAEAAMKAAPHAVQVADRWHLLRNMSQALQGTLVPHHHLLAEVAQDTARGEPAATSPVEQQPTSIQCRSRKQRAQEQNRECRLARYETVMAQARQGTSEREIARNCGLGRQTVHRWISARSFPERRPSSHTSMLDPHQEFLEQRWQPGCHNTAQLWRELCEQGFLGQSRAVRDWIKKHRGSQRCPAEQSLSATTPPRSSPRQVAWLLLKQPEEARFYSEELYQRSPEIAQCASLAREFCRIIRQRDVSAWLRWHDEAIRSPLANFAKHLCRDEAAVLAALQQPWSNGPVEGHVHRLKLIKRFIYGRANFDLLRIRVANSA